MFLKTVRFICRIILRIIAKVELIDFDRAPEEGAALVVGNHLGRLDAMLGMILTDREDIIMLVADKYREYPFWRWVVEKMDAVWLNRDDADFYALRLLQRGLQAGGVATIAPEGTRSKAESLLPGKPGAAFIAAKTGVPVIPMAVTGTEDRVVKKRLTRLRRLHIVIRVGEPFTIPPINRKNRDEFLQQATDEMMCRIAVLLPEEYRGVYAEHPRLKELVE
ncbi:MAG: 1-acyl-sn-glycerol-3-phosphate acyltransferase [Chloroflexi bacterium]|nr:MAG: 1-acyl-sn-glycerol-3-phosphate acyltransferase [Chloroflexota bacterium]